jgi:hypothetical protein
MTDAVDVHVRRGMPYSFVVAAVLLLCAGAVAIFYFDSFWGVLIPLTLVFFQRAGWRILYKLLWLLIVIPFMPEKWRHAYFELAKEISQVALRGWNVTQRIWVHAPWWLRVIMSLSGACASGVVALFFLVIPVHVGKIPFVGVWMQEVAMPYLMQTAAARGIEANIPLVWRRMPGAIRLRFDSRYRRLWWWTARWGVRTRQAVGRRTAIVARKGGKDSYYRNYYGQYY